MLAVRSGTKKIVTTGMLLIASFYAPVALTTSPTLNYGIIAIQMVIYGLGLGLTSAPATESIRGAVAGQKAGVGSAINDATRLIGGTLGVAILGSLFTSLYQSKIANLATRQIPVRTVTTMKQSVGAGYTVAGQVATHGNRAVGSLLANTTTSALLHGLKISCVVASLIALAGAGITLKFLPAQSNHA